MPKFAHKPVLLAEVIAALRPAAGGRYGDLTVGGGGHAWTILQASGPDGWLLGGDRDGAALEAAQDRLKEFAGRFELHRGAFDQVRDWVPAGSLDGVLMDLGVSSPQLDQAGRGFSFQQDGPLDMRMDQRQGMTAAHLVNETPEAELAELFWRFGGEQQSRRIARAVVEERGRSAFATTRQLAEFIERVVPRHGQRIHPATRVFQALRMVVNDEANLLCRGLQAAWDVLRKGGRLAVITFHSLEVQNVKEFGRERERDYRSPGPVDVPELRVPKKPELQWLNRRAIQPGEAELAENPRARSAQLRVMEKL